MYQNVISFYTSTDSNSIKWFINQENHIRQCVLIIIVPEATAAV